ncbi:MAG: 6-phosphogluconolactonase, partial [Candidatus Pacearchaeota archaeon]
MKVIEGKRKDLEKKASNIIELEIKKLLKEKKSIVFGIVGGKSIVGILKQIKNSDIEWNKVHIFMVDERRVSLKNKESNFKIVNEFLLNYLIKNKKIKKKNIHPYHYSTPIKKYSNELKKHGGKFDIIILSSGEDGHIAGLFPNSTIKN